MDALKTKRKSLRTSFTTTANKLKECLAKKEDAKDGDKLRAVKSQLQDKFLRLDEIQNKISSLLLENNETAAEYESDFQAAEDYRDNFLELKSKIETLLNKDFGSFLESPPELDVVGHLAKRCHSSVRCLICKRRHYPLLCPDLRKGKESNFSPKDRTADNEQRSTETLLTNLPSEHEIYLKTIMIRLRNRDKEVCARALLDDGSQRSYIEKNLAAELFLSPSGREIFSQGLFGGGISPASEHKRYMVNVESLNRKYSTPLSLLEQQKICSTLPRIHDRKLLSELSSRGIKLTDVGRDSPPIRVLLGADILGSILTGRIELYCYQKLLMQEAWRGKIGWDEVLPVELEHKYRLWERTMHFMSKCAISRRLFAENYDDFTVHIFTDASAYAYAACAFLRCEFKGQVTVKLMAAKARLAPMKKSTIPRLELLGATLGARLAETVDSILRTTSKTYFWCDSMVVLSWIKKKEPWNTFVGNRVKEIRDLTNIDDWRHVPGEVNPADLATRCCDWSDLLQSKWWEGPGWLYNDEESWPCSEVSETPDEAFLERRKTVVTNVATENEVRFGDRLLYFSSYRKILRMTAYVLRFCNNIKRNSPKLVNSLSCEEIQKAEETLIKIMQSEWPSEIREKYKDTIQFYEEKGILKVQTRLILSQDPEDFTHPTVLPDHPLLERLVLHTHRSLMHAGVLTTLAQLREKFWIPKGRRVHMLKRVRYLHTLRSNLRKRFYKEYLGELVRSPKVASRRKIISPGEIVIVESKNPNRMNWPLAQVIELFPGKDGVERVAKLRLA
ncbi:integrase catalytic domain-containing protein, partial [Trichonephila clavata]